MGSMAEDSKFRVQDSPTDESMSKEKTMTFKQLEASKTQMKNFVSRCYSGREHQWPLRNSTHRF